MPSGVPGVAPVSVRDRACDEGAASRPVTSRPVAMPAEAACNRRTVRLRGLWG
ncbi:hypothetical protein [Streptomyces sp. CS62]|uniref:hypothetical protein n=1 Tax=Streptomyces sp. CS62 TaxID=3119268 RepID=UPI002F941608